MVPNRAAGSGCMRNRLLTNPGRRVHTRRAADRRFRSCSVCDLSGCFTPHVEGSGSSLRVISKEISPLFGLEWVEATRGHVGIGFFYYLIPLKGAVRSPITSLFCTEKPRFHQAVQFSSVSYTLLNLVKDTNVLNVVFFCSSRDINVKDTDFP